MRWHVTARFVAGRRAGIELELPTGQPVRVAPLDRPGAELVLRALGEGRVRVRAGSEPVSVRGGSAERSVDDRVELDLSDSAATLRVGPDVLELSASRCEPAPSAEAPLRFQDETPPPPRPVPRRPRAPFRAARRRPALPQAVLTSLVSHAAIALLLALLLGLVDWQADRPPRRVELRWAAAPPPALDDPEARPGAHADDRAGDDVPLDASHPAFGQDGEGSAEPGEDGRALDEIEETTTEGTGGRPAGRAFAARAPARRAREAAGGGEAAAEGAVRRALDWLARHQSADGTWSASGFDHACPDTSCAGDGESTFTVGTTGLALLPFLGAGHGHLEGAWAPNVRKGLVALLDRQRPDGTFASGDARGYEDALATFALAEAFGLTRAKALREPVERAVAAWVRTQSDAGGWRYHPGDGQTDTSVTAWVALALSAARRAGVDVPRRTLAGCRRWMGHAIDRDGRVGYRGPTVSTTALTGAGLAVSVFLGADPRRAPLDSVAHRLVVAPPRWDGDAARGRYVFDAGDPSHWYYGSLAAFQVGGGAWRAWNPRLRDLLVGRQRTDGHALGSWDLRGQTGHRGGRVVMTALCALSLEVVYRYPRLRDWRIGDESAVPSSTPR